MTDVNNDNRKNDVDNDSLISGTHGTYNPVSSMDTNEANKMHNVNISHSDVTKMKDHPMTSTQLNKSEEATNVNVSSDLNNQQDTINSTESSSFHKSTAINNVSTSSIHDQSERMDVMNVSSDGKQTERRVESVPSLDPDELQRKDDASASFEQNDLGKSNKMNISSNSREGERIEDSTSSRDHNELKRKLDSNIYSNSNESNTSSDSDISYSLKEPDLLEPVLKNKNNQDLINRLLGCAYGQALGDAYGLSTEFEDRRSVAYYYPDSSILIPFPDYRLTGHSRRWTRGDWTDDTDQWILILETLTEYNGDVKIFAKKLTHWIRNGYRELGDYGGMGLGANVSQVVRSNGYLEDPLEASETVWKRGNCQAAPNGAVMRCSASAFVHFKNPEQVKSTAEIMCKATHFDPRCIASCLAVCLTITYLLQEKYDDNNIESLIQRVQKETIEILGDNFSGEARDQFIWHTDVRTLEELNLDEPRSIGYTYKCLASGFYGLRSKESFEKTLNDLIRYGGDADTNGAVCGTMYGARYGYKALPYEWLRAMPFKKWFDKKLIKCLQGMNLIDT